MTKQETEVVMHTNQGDIRLKLYNETPLHRDNFVKLAREGQYNGLLFHRVIRDFMIQGGDVTSKDAPMTKQLGAGDLGYTVPAEFNYPTCFHKKGALCAARMGDDANPKRASSATQFYIVTGKVYTESELAQWEKRGAKMSPEVREAYGTIGGVPFLDNQYTVYGEVIEGLEVVDRIQCTQTNRQDRPTENIVIESVEIRSVGE